MTTVALVNLGDNLSINLEKFANRMNSLQTTWQFRVVAAQPNIGQPDYEDIFYQIEHLLRELANHQPANFEHVVIGLTHVRLATQDPASGHIEKDYFSLSDENRLAVVTEYMKMWNSPNKDLYQYYGYVTVCELLTLMAKKSLVHQSKDRCLFDDCADRSEFTPGIQSGKICPQCRKSLQQAKVPDSAIDDAVRVLKWCRRNTTAKASQMTASNPYVTLVAGAALGWAASAFIGGERYRIVGFVTLLIILIVFIRNRLASN
jgi:hypothetical protein